MEYKNGEQCPRFDFLLAGSVGCKNCKCRVMDTEDGVDCDYSQVPNCEPLFKKGDYAYRIISHIGLRVEREKVRVAKWDANHWEYVFGREQRSYRAYATEKEAYEALCKIQLDTLVKNAQILKNNMEKCGLSLTPGDVEKLLIGSQEK